DSALRGVLLFQPAYDDAVMQRSDIQSHCVDLHSIYYKNSSTLCDHPRALRMKRFLVFLPRSFEVVGFLLLLVSFPFGAFPFLKLCPVRDSNFGCRTRSSRVNDKPKVIAGRSADQIEGILRILPRREGPVLQVIESVHGWVDFRLNTSRGTVFRRNGLHHIWPGKPFRGVAIVGHGHLVELTV